MATTRRNVAPLAIDDRARARTVDPDRARALRTITALVGATFLVVGVLGFIPGITTNVDRMDFAGHESPSQLFDVFQVSVLHNLVHVAFGVVGLVAARTLTASRTYLLLGGIIYLALFVYGIAIDKDSGANFVPLDEADDWLHLGLGLGMVALGLIPTSRPADRTDRAGAVAGDRDVRSRS
jgi:hypothetical protein